MDQLPPNRPPPLAIPALALGAFGLGTNEFAAVGHMIWLTRCGARLLRVEHHQRDGRLDRRCGDRRGLRHTARAAAGAALAAGGLVILTISVLSQHREAVRGLEHDGSNT